jgi:uncharacterized protein YndB with AHSA1/START domain
MKQRRNEEIPMNSAVRNPSGVEFPPLTVSRMFAATPEHVFAAWSSAEHLRHWFCPALYTVPQARIEFRVGGAFEICMRSPTGQQHWTRGQYTRIVPHSRLAIDMQVQGDGPDVLFRAELEVSFVPEAGGTLLKVVQRFTPLDPAAGPMIQGAPLGWSQTLDRLGQELARMSAAVVHSSFRIERTFGAARAEVYRALTDPAAKAKWFTGGDGYTQLAREMDVRSGGRELLKGRWPNGLVTSFEASYHDVVPDRRLVYSYVMHLDARKISVSLATFELEDAGAGTHLVLTEQHAFLDGYEDAGSRERGTNALLDALGRSLP